MARYPIFQFHEGDPDLRPAESGAPERPALPRPQGEEAKPRPGSQTVGRTGRVFQIPW